MRARRLPLDELRRQAGHVDVLPLEFAQGGLLLVVQRLAARRRRSSRRSPAPSPGDDACRPAKTSPRRAPRRRRPPYASPRRRRGSPAHAPALQACGRVRRVLRRTCAAPESGFARERISTSQPLQAGSPTMPALARALRRRGQLAAATCRRRTKNDRAISWSWLVAALHFYFMYLEMIAWDTPARPQGVQPDAGIRQRLEGARRQSGALQRLPRRRADLGASISATPASRSRCSS